MTFPRVVKVGPVRYQVRVVPEDDLTDYGQHRPSEQALLIRRSGSKDHMRDTLLHEVLHAIWYQTHLASDIYHSREEEVVRTLSPRILDVLRRNPALVRALLEV